MKNTKICCFSGHRSEKLTGSVEWITEELGKAIDQAVSDGFTFYHGGCNGIDLMAAEQVLLRRGIDNSLRLIAVLPYEEQAKHWNESWRERYYNVLAKCDEVITLHTKYVDGCYQERNQYMVNQSRRLIAVYHDFSLGGTRNTILYAQKKGLELKIIPIP